MLRQKNSSKECVRDYEQRDKVITAYSVADFNGFNGFTQCRNNDFVPNNQHITRPINMDKFKLRHFVLQLKSPSYWRR
jgi:hypothetical protein